MSREWSKICSTLIKFIDAGREKWFSLLIELLTEFDKSKVVNTDLKSDLSIGIGEGSIPDNFPFNRISGETCEAGLMGWQLQGAVAIALNNKYMVEDEMGIFFETLIRNHFAGNDRRMLSTATIYGKDISATDGIALALSYYITNQTLNSPFIVDIAQEIEARMAFLAGFTHAAVATAFGDANTAQRIMTEL